MPNRQEPKSTEFVPIQILVRQFLRIFFAHICNAGFGPIYISGEESQRTKEKFGVTWRTIDREVQEDARRISSALQPDPVTGMSHEFLGALVTMSYGNRTPDEHGYYPLTYPHAGEETPHLSIIAMRAAIVYMKA